MGTQYRSVIFYHSPEQRETAEEIIAEMERDGVWESPVVTEISPAPEFFRAEDYHQEYYRQHSRQPYCQVVIAPKLASFRESFRERLKA